jgi:hypothetical protein
MLNTNYILSPLLMQTAFYMFGNFKVEATVGAARLIAQDHIGFFGSAATFFDIATDASRNDVFPRITSVARTGNYVI